MIFFDPSVTFGLGLCIYRQNGRTEENKTEDEPNTEVTITRQTDNTDRKSLVIAGQINPNKEYKY